MLVFYSNNSAQTFVVTLNELVTIENPNYLFVFKNITTKEFVKIVLVGSENDQSLFKYRYNQFELDISILFANKPVGQWLYEVYQQSSLVNQDPELSDGLIENGRMELKSTSNFEYETYNNQTSFKVYNG